MEESMENNKEKFRVCWNVISTCNSNCEYCHKFIVKERPFKENKKILRKMIEEGVTNITWSGGEALLYPDIVKLMKISKSKGVRNKLITNGIIISNMENREKEKLFNELDEIVLSIDAIDDDTNKKLGRGKKHYENVKRSFRLCKR